MIMLSGDFAPFPSFPSYSLCEVWGRFTVAGTISAIRKSLEVMETIGLEDSSPHWMIIWGLLAQGSERWHKPVHFQRLDWLSAACLFLHEPQEHIPVLATSGLYDPGPDPRLVEVPPLLNSNLISKF